MQTHGQSKLKSSFATKKHYQSFANQALIQKYLSHLHTLQAHTKRVQGFNFIFEESGVIFACGHCTYDFPLTKHILTFLSLFFIFLFFSYYFVFATYGRFRPCYVSIYLSRTRDQPQILQGQVRPSLKRTVIQGRGR